MAQEEMMKMMMMRRGPWTEQEDVQLVLYVNMFGDRRWDFLAKVSGLKRSGKSCRLRWVNYLQPGLKRGKITPQEQRLILQLHSKWGNRWSKIAQKLPGRTDNEIKNYWRTHMRKKANEDRANKCASSSSSSSLSNNSSSSSGASSSPPAVDSRPIPATNERNFYDTGGIIFEDETKTTPPQQQQEEEEIEKKMDHHHQQQQQVCSSSMDDIWKDMELWAEQQKGGCTMWNYWSEWVWTTTCSSSSNNRMCPPPPPPASTDRLCFFDNQDYICTI